MRVAFGMKAHSGWAAMVAIGRQGGTVQVVDRRRLELVAKAEQPWGKKTATQAMRQAVQQALGWSPSKS
jgi:hypothetical protein